MNDTFTDELQIDIDSDFTDTPPLEEEPPSDVMEILPNGDVPVITATPTPVPVTATPTPVPEVTTQPPEQAEAPKDVETLEPSPTPIEENKPLGDSSETSHTIDDIYILLTERVQAYEEQQKAEQEKQEKETQALLEYRSYMVEQSKNVVSVSSLIFITLAFLSGLILARIVWRKL